MELNLLHDFNLVYVTSENISSSIISKIRLIPCAVVVMILNLLLIIFFAVPYLLMKEAFSSAL